ncbi:MAG: hypothetical protein LBD04_04845 [Synergistaceae bacterium]|jgi:hypothetical protein|nr:hypothetical protein [Synergistaceae bacterium]
MFKLPEYRAPNFDEAPLKDAPPTRTSPALADGVAPSGYHALSIFPEYFKVGDSWLLVEESRMDCLPILRGGGRAGPWVDAVEFRCLKRGDAVVMGRTEDGSEGIYVNAEAFVECSESAEKGGGDVFAFRANRSRETAYSRDYDNLYELLRHEREHGSIVWVLGPAVSFDHDSRAAMNALIGKGYVHALLSGNALATHDLEGALLHTALGQDIYTQKSTPMGHYHHLDLLNLARSHGSLETLVEQERIEDGIIHAILKKGVPLVLAGSIRDDGPLPSVYSGAYEAQDAMRAHIRKASTVLALATQLHAIAAGNMTPSYTVRDGRVRPVYFYSVDVSEFAVNKLRDRGSLSSISIVTNVQDFLVRLAHNL